MSTNSMIACNGRAIHVIYDGYIEGVGATLNEFYMEEDIVNKLIDCGHIDSLHSTPEESKEDTKYSSDSPIGTYANLSELKRYSSKYFRVQFIYEFVDGEWTTYKINYDTRRFNKVKKNKKQDRKVIDKICRDVYLVFVSRKKKFLVGYINKRTQENMVGRIKSWWNCGCPKKLFFRWWLKDVYYSLCRIAKRLCIVTYLFLKGLSVVYMFLATLVFLSFPFNWLIYKNPEFLCTSLFVLLLMLCGSAVSIAFGFIFMLISDSINI